MSLDIRVIKKLGEMKHDLSDEDADYYPLPRIYANPDFPEYADGIKEGWYEVGKNWGFRAGSYHGYGWWCDKLCEIVHNNMQPVGGPFWELVVFGVEGAIGPKTSAKLAKDFADHENVVNLFCGLQSPDDGGLQAPDDDYKWWLAKYQDWKKAFEDASDGGAVMFA